MAPLHVATLTVEKELPKNEIIFSIYGLYPTSVPRMNKTMAPLHVATLTVEKKLHIIFSIYLCTKNETMTPLHVAILTVEKEL